MHEAVLLVIGRRDPVRIVGVPLEWGQRHDPQAHIGKPQGLDWIVDLPAVSATVGAAERTSGRSPPECPGHVTGLRRYRFRPWTRTLPTGSTRGSAIPTRWWSRPCRTHSQR